MSDKIYICAPFGVIMGGLGSLLGGFDTTLKCLMFMMVLDFACGFASAGFFDTSKYSKNGITSKAMIQGAIRKMSMLAIVAVGVVINKILDLDYVRNCIVMYFIASEGISILEHMIVMGVPFPPIIKECLDVIMEKGEK